jgi:hypothetical protein
VTIAYNLCRSGCRIAAVRYRLRRRIGKDEWSLETQSEISELTCVGTTPFLWSVSFKNTKKIKMMPLNSWWTQLLSEWMYTNK